MKSTDSLSHRFDVFLQSAPDEALLIYAERAWSRQDIHQLSEQMLRLLHNAGVGINDCVVAQYDTRPEDLALALAVSRLGAVLMPIPKRLGMREVRYLVDISNAKVLVFADTPPSEVVAGKSVAVVNLMDAKTLAPMSMCSTDVDEDAIAIIGVTSGSTGMPKGVMHSWKTVAWAAERMRALTDLQPGERVLVTGAGAGAPGFTFFSYLAMACGITIVKAEKWEPKEVLRLAHEHRCVWSTMVPTMLQMLLDVRVDVLGDTGALTHMRAITMGGAFMSAGLIQQARKELGVEVLRMYAMAECMSHSSMLMTDRESDRDVYDGSAGPDSDFRIFDDERQELPIGAVGEVGLRGGSLFNGYLADEALKSSLMTASGHFLSGDLGKVTPSGFIQIVGRKKDMIIRGGYNIDPSEVEVILRQHSAVAKVVVVGIPDKIFGEKACAVVETHRAQPFAFDAMISLLKDSGLSKEKFPESLRLIEQMPLSPDGKILKARVKEIVTDVSGI